MNQEISPGSEQTAGLSPPFPAPEDTTDKDSSLCSPLAFGPCSDPHPSLLSCMCFLCNSKQPGFG